MDKALRIVYAPPDRDRILSLQDTLRAISDVIGIEPPDLIIPERGFLVGNMTQEQRDVLNAVLGPDYAEQNATQQSMLREIPIEECGDPMVSLHQTFNEHGVEAIFSNRPFHEACASWAGEQRVFFLRRDVALKITAAFRALNRVGCIPQIEDAWRHFLVQRGLLVRRMVAIARDYSDWDWKKVQIAAMSFTAPAPGLAGHQAGAAIDWQLCSATDRQLLDLGNAYPEGGAASSLDFPYVTQEQWTTRTLFRATMHMAGMKLLRTEDWHASHGDRGMGIDGQLKMAHAHYGPITDFDRRTGEIVPYHNDMIEGHYLTNDQCAQLIGMSREQAGPGTFRISLDELYRQFNPANGAI